MATPTRSSTARMWLIGAAAAALVVAVVVVVNRGGSDGDAGRIEHVHGLGVNPADGPDGLTWDSRSTLDLFGFAVSPTDPDLILAATPAGLVRSTDGDQVYVAVQDDGILGSRDAGATWDRLHP